MARPLRPSASPLTISHVAREAGVSEMTVSRVLNGRQNVSATTRERVSAVIKAMGYTPNPAARRLAGGSRLRVGLLDSNPSAFFLREFLAGGFASTDHEDIQLIVKHPAAGSSVETLVRQVADAGLDGIVLPPPLCESIELLDALAADGVPVVTIASARPAAGVPSVGIDDQEAASIMTRHLIALGHHRIGFIQGSPDLHASALRLKGHLAALGEAGLPHDPALIVPGAFTYRSGLDAAEELLSLAERPTAIFSSNDDMAAAVIAVAHGDRLDVPGDLTVCGFDDTGFAISIWPALTTIRQPIAEMTDIALGMIASLVRNGAHALAEPHRRLDVELIRRQSDAPPRRRRRDARD